MPGILHMHSVCFYHFQINVLIVLLFPSLCILGKIMAAKFLHREIREKGGAYGGGAKMRGDGLFAFYSYR